MLRCAKALLFGDFPPVGEKCNLDYYLEYSTPT